MLVHVSVTLYLIWTMQHHSLKFLEVKASPVFISSLLSLGNFTWDVCLVIRTIRILLMGKKQIKKTFTLDIKCAPCGAIYDQSSV